MQLFRHGRTVVGWAQQLGLALLGFTRWDPPRLRPRIPVGSRHDRYMASLLSKETIHKNEDATAKTHVPLLLAHWISDVSKIILGSVRRCIATARLVSFRSAQFPNAANQDWKCRLSMKANNGTISGSKNSKRPTLRDSVL
jgi:hypothetical protein